MTSVFLEVYLYYENTILSDHTKQDHYYNTYMDNLDADGMVLLQVIHGNAKTTASIEPRLGDQNEGE